MSLSELAWTPLWLSLKVAVAATLLCLTIGTALGYLLARKQFVGKNLLDAFLTLPLVLPPTVLGYYLLVLLGRHGWLGELLTPLGIQFTFTLKGAVIAAAVVCLPLIIRPARAAFEQIPQQYEQAARSLGLGEAAVFLRISLPLAWRSILAAAMLCFARAFGEFGATLMVAGSIPGETQTLSIAVYEAVQAGRDSLANWLALLISISCMLLLLLMNRLLQRNHPDPLK